SSAVSARPALSRLIMVVECTGCHRRYRDDAPYLLGRGRPPYGWHMTVGPLEALRRRCLALPETTERLSHGEPTWFVREQKTFVPYADHPPDDRLAFWCAAPPGAQEALVGADPQRYFVPPYVGHRGWLGVYLDVPVRSH